LTNSGPGLATISKNGGVLKLGYQGDAAVVVSFG
jgi:hypothetical protein